MIVSVAVACDMLCVWTDIWTYCDSPRGLLSCCIVRRTTISSLPPSLNCHLTKTKKCRWFQHSAHAFFIYKLMIVALSTDVHMCICMMGESILNQHGWCIGPQTAIKLETGHHSWRATTCTLHLPHSLHEAGDSRWRQIHKITRFQRTPEFWLFGPAIFVVISLLRNCYMTHQFQVFWGCSLTISRIRSWFRISRPGWPGAPLTTSTQRIRHETHTSFVFIRDH